MAHAVYRVTTEAADPPRAWLVPARVKAAMPGRPHSFLAHAFVENIALKEVATAYPGARRTVHELIVPLAEGEMYIYPFGAVTFHDVARERRDAELDRLRTLGSRLTPALIVSEEFLVREDPDMPFGVSEGILIIDRLNAGRASIVALTVAQSVSMEYYETIIEQMMARTDTFVSRLETRGTVSLRTQRLHRFIGAAVGTRTEVLSILHLLDKPDATWDDPAMDRIYADLRAEFDLADRFEALERKLRSVQEALELILDVARDRRLVLLEFTIVILIVMEILLSLFHNK